MGITGLLPFVEKASSKCNLSELKGQTLAVDAYCWLHKGTYGCADKLVLGQETMNHINYCMKYVNMLLSHGIKPILVFDGRHLPAKLETEKKRRDNRKAARIRAAEFLRLGKTEDARLNFRRAVDVTHEMALQLMKECRKVKVDCIVAPYEADSQLAYLNLKNAAHVVVTEDSDLLTFGCKKVLFKLDLTGNGILVDAEKLYIPMQMRQENYTFEKFQMVCVLSGCDYLESLPGIGLKKSLKFFKATENPDIYNCLTKIPSYLNMKQLTVSEEYRRKFMIALATFRHQVVFDPVSRRTVHLTEKDDGMRSVDERFCCNAGELIEDDDVAFQLAVGNLDPFTLKRVNDWKPPPNDPFSRSIWSAGFRQAPPPKLRADASEGRKNEVRGTSTIVDAAKLLERSEREKDEFDAKMLSEINALYKSPPPKKPKWSNDDAANADEERAKEDEAEAEEELSPILTRKSVNPFIKARLKKASGGASSTIVKSRFFQGKLAKAEPEPSSNLSLLESIDKSVAIAKEANAVAVAESDEENCSPPESKSAQTLVESNAQTQPQTQTAVDVERSISERFSKFRSERECRRPGLSKRNVSKAKIPDKNQPSILSMFQFVKK